MDGGRLASASALVVKAHVADDDCNPLATIRAAFGATPLDLILVFASPERDLAALAATTQAAFADATVVGCTTAGEICDGYREGSVVAIGLPRALFTSRSVLIERLSQTDPGAVAEAVDRCRRELAADAPHWEEFAFLLVDGLSTSEDSLAATLASALGPVPLFGGSAGDGTRFARTLVAHRGTVRTDAAVVTLIRTACRPRLFKTDHMRPSTLKMVVTEAVPEHRVVRQINGAPAAREYARILGLDPDGLDPFTFAAYPLVVKMGGQHHVRAIQRVTDAGEIVFFCAIDEGMVLTLAAADDMAAHLTRELGRLAEAGPPAAILACDCLLRRLEAEQKQVRHTLSAILKAHNVVGFSTYGEQFNAMHVNQTLTGVALYPPVAGRL